MTYVQDTVEVTYDGQLRTQAKHLVSGEEIVTDAPLDNHGLGQSFSPTDLVAASLVSCMLTVIGIRAEKEGWPMQGVQGAVRKVMTTAPRRIAELHVRLSFPHRFQAIEQETITRLAQTCPVAESIHAGILVNLEISFDGA
jgi:uncharacterized OsmC-like protein